MDLSVSAHAWVLCLAPSEQAFIFAKVGSATSYDRLRDSPISHLFPSIPLKVD